MSPRGICNLPKANGKDYNIEAPTFFYVCDIDDMTVEEGEKKEFTMIISDLPTTIDTEKFVSSISLHMNGFMNRWVLREMFLKSTFELEKGFV